MRSELIGRGQYANVAVPINNIWRDTPSDYRRFPAKMDRNRVLKSQISRIMSNTIIELVSRDKRPIEHSIRQAENERFLHLCLAALRLVSSRTS